MNRTALAITYTIYILSWELLCWVGCAYLVIYHGWSAWWFVLAFYLSCSAYKPARWGEMWGNA